MTKKGKRVASRQAELGQERRRKTRRVPAVPPATPSAPGEPVVPKAEAAPLVTQEAGVAPAQTQRTPAVASPATSPARPPARPAARAGARSSQTAVVLDVSPYVKRELLRIGVLCAAIVAVLVGLTFVLG